MGILSWLQSKFRGKQAQRDDVGSSTIPNPSQQEFDREFINSLPSLLTIGTLGSDEFTQDDQRIDSFKNKSFLQNLIDVTAEEEVQLRDLTQLSSKTNGDGSQTVVLQNDIDPKLYNDLNDEDNDADMLPYKKLTLNRTKHMLSENCNLIKQKPISLIVKNIFICRSGFTLASKLTDPVPESKMEKFYKAILHKKVYPQHSSQQTKCLEKRRKETAWDDDEMHKKGEKGGQWVRTDSECKLSMNNCYPAICWF
ncbi:protein NEGATIVE GRAVITROPIC RESPONSE OF ROOTS-like isoform X1 [Zingiber officinale]|uniref:protein NEGATIVE GRAVITROPIC RESPONSE OF ROOTS-like isoform X1 n=1 Tax=Zingiber officinale TaxID=94328 RepID=UPI001C4AAE55|nr:protein NEGATIVE GRAVITROPIC RESPONSE OF ROOTS-like isoform X1 [Zingiber officinale]